VKEAWWRDMVTGHDELAVQDGAPSEYEMTGLDCTIIMHPQVWKCSGTRPFQTSWSIVESKSYRHDQVRGRWVGQRQASI
jgi:glycyl-tRNA synthetase